MGLLKALNRHAIAWMDRRFYPNDGDGWDNVRFRSYLDGYVSPECRVLDFGAGRGILEQLDLRGAVAHVAATDPDPAVLQNPHVHEARVLPLATAEIPYPPASFDLVYSANVLEHVDRPNRVMREVYRVLKPGGHFISKTPNAAHYVPRIARLTPHAFHEYVNRLRRRAVRDTFPTLYRCNSATRVARLARRTGFEIRNLQLWEGRPEYLRLTPLTYMGGLAYERIVNAVPGLAHFRAVLTFSLQKPPELHPGGAQRH